HRAEAWDQALAALHEASPHPFPPMEAERQRLLAETYWRLGRLEAAANAWSTYQDHALTSGEAAVGADWQARLTWLKANKK
ncbi:MAG TPA: hypothetical protein VFH51_03485, partial [Myxococcota bacterium]|nr:hypothetical protein [Myxococcota bacterium]